MVECRRCNKQYIGETKRQLKERFNEHRGPVNRKVHPNNCKLTAVSEHFLSPNHSVSDMQLIPLELIKSNRDNMREAREARQTFNYSYGSSRLIRMPIQAAFTSKAVTRILQRDIAS